MSGTRIALAALLYGAMFALATGLGALRGALLPISHGEPWLELGEHRVTVSLGLGMALTALVVGSTRVLVARTEWARNLRDELRPLVVGASGAQIAALALLSGIAEEWLFRGALQPLIGLGLATLVFGLAHLGPGRRFAAWALWAAVVGLFLGLIFEVTGSLAGPVLAHVGINWMNLHFIARRDIARDARPAPVGPRLVTDRTRASG